MTFDKALAKYIRPIPEGYYRVFSGPILPDDLCLSCYQGVWLPFGSTEWTGTPATLAEDAFMVARKARHQPAPGQAVRSYSLRKETPAETPPAPERGQASLF